MKKNYFRIICAILVVCLLFPSCTGTEGVTSKEHILKAWSGEFSEEALISTIEEYRSNYQPVGSADKSVSVTIETDFDISSYTVSRISKVDDSNIEVELHGYIDLIIDTERNGRQITFKTDWWHRAGEKTKKYTIWSYLVLIRDTEGEDHYYYFRTDYSSGTATPHETEIITEPDYTPMKGAAVEYLTARDFAPDRTAGEVSDGFREAYADFALKLMNESRSEFEGDALLVSPLSAMIALAMTANGAEGETLAEMEKVLGGGLSIEKLNAELFNYTSSLISTDDAKFNLANAVWVTSSPSFSINKNFVKTIENTFDADIVAADLPNSITDINDWAKEETFGMIPSILNDGDLDADTVMVLLNALALDALWANQADDHACFEDQFHVTDKNVQKATFMRTECEGYIEGKGVTGIVKNYKGGNYAFLALLPEGDVYEYAASLDGEDLLKLYDKRIKATGSVEVSAKIPHFSFDCKIEMKEVLKKMGMVKAFDSAGADLSGLGTDSRGNLSISRVIQKTHIDLDNSGTRAAAVTAVTIKAEGGIMNAKFYRVDLDRPFLYAIIDTATGLPIFLGVCENISGQ